MPAPKGNTYWEFAHTTGRPKKHTPDSVWKLAVEYFDWCEKNPWKEEKPFGTGFVAIVNKSRPYTEIGFRLFAGISNGTWENYSSGKEGYEDFLEVTTRIKEIVYTQKFEGAATGFFNPNIIARDLGLSDKKELTGKDGAPIAVTGMQIINE